MRDLRLLPRGSRRFVIPVAGALGAFSDCGVEA
jgi:hypothetical protein